MSCAPGCRTCGPASTTCAASSAPSTPRPPTGTPTSNSPTTSTASSPGCAAAPPPPASASGSGCCGCSSRTSSSDPRRSPSATASRSGNGPPAAAATKATPTRRVTCARVIHCVGGVSRLLLQNVVAPNFGSLAERFDGMTATAETRRVSAFKVYTAWGPGGHGFDLDDPAVGLPVVQHAHDLGVNVLCANKGLPLLNFESTWNQPRDMGAVSRQFSGMQFVVYHAAWTPQYVEGPYNPANPVGVDSLIWALDRYKVPPNSNVWADIATVWRSLLADPVQAAHMLGKLLSRLGQDRVLWGTDSVWYGPPQTQIMAFRAFHISAEYQARYGYPALTDDVKARVLGLNAADLFGLDPHAVRCALDSDKLA